MKQLKVTHRITSINNESFKQYLKEVSEISTFTPEEEIECSIKAASGDQKAIDELTKRNLRFVISVAKQYATETIPLEDLVNEGNLGLIMAVKKFEPTMGYKFISYAVWWIRKIILEYIGNHGKMVRLPANKITGISNLDKKIHELEQRLGRKPDINEICEHFDDESHRKEYQLLNKISNTRFDSLDVKIGNDADSETTLGETIADDIFGSTDHLMQSHDVTCGIEASLNKLKPREKFVIEAFFGLNGKHQMTMSEIGENLNLSSEMIRQIKMKTLDKLKKNGSMRLAFDNII